MKRPACGDAGAGRPGLVALALSCILCTTALPWASPARAQGDFYRAAAAEVPGTPGTLIRAEPMDGAPLSAAAWRVLYRSTGLRGEPIAVSGVVVVPAGQAPPGGRPVVAWAHPTSGIVPRCAPSLAHFIFRDIQGLEAMLAHGFVVAATDYPGLGTPGPHPYLIGASEARAVLDAVRVARQLPGGGSTRYALWGHSQGGQAALFAGILTGSYAPELEPVGVAVAAPATDLQTLLRDDFDTDGGRNLTAMTLWSWSRVFGLPIDRLVDPAAMPAMDALAGECIESLYDILQRRISQRGLQQHFLAVPDLTRVEPWATLLRQNIPGPLPPALPLFIAQGEADTLVRPAVTQAYRDRQCAAGGKVQLQWMPGEGHGFAGRDAAPAAVSWMADRFAGRPVPDGCGG